MMKMVIFTIRVVGSYGDERLVNSFINNININISNRFLKESYAIFKIF